MGEEQQEELDLEEGEIPESPGNVAEEEGAIDEGEIKDDPPPNAEEEENKEPQASNPPKTSEITEESQPENSQPEPLPKPKKKRHHSDERELKHKYKSSKKSKTVKLPKYRDFEDELEAYSRVKKGLSDGMSDHSSADSADNWDDIPPKFNHHKRKHHTHYGHSSKKFRSSGREKKRPPIRMPKERFKAICKFFLEGKCFKGPECNYSHSGNPVRRRELCKYYLQGSCFKGDNCNYMHQDFPCKFFHTGATCYSGDKCKFSHEPLTDETRRILDRYLSNSDHPSSHHGPDDYESPSKRPSLLGSPPRHIKDAAGPWQKHMRDIQKTKGGDGHKPNFYVDTLSNSSTLQTPPHEQGGQTPPYCEEDGGSWDDSNEYHHKQDTDERINAPPPIKPEIWANDVDMREMYPQPPPNSIQVTSPPSHRSPDQQEIPLTALPPKTRELYQRIHQQQKDMAEKAEKNALGTPVLSEDSWTGERNTSDEDDDDDDQKLAESLKKIQTAQPPPTMINPQSSILPNTSHPPPIDVSKILNVIPNQPPTFWNNITSIVTSVVSSTNSQNPQPLSPFTSVPPIFPPLNQPPLQLPPTFNPAIPPPMMPIPPPAIVDFPKPPETTVPTETPVLPPSVVLRDPRLSSRDPRNRDPRQAALAANTAANPTIADTKVAIPPLVKTEPSDSIYVNGLRGGPPMPYKLREATRSQINYFQYVMTCHSHPHLCIDPRLAKRIEQTPKTLFPQNVNLESDVKDLAKEKNQTSSPFSPPNTTNDSKPLPLKSHLPRSITDPRLARLHMPSDSRRKVDTSIKKESLSPKESPTQLTNVTNVNIVKKDPSPNQSPSHSPPISISLTSIATEDIPNPQSPPELKKVEPLEPFTSNQDSQSPPPPLLTEEGAATTESTSSGAIRKIKKKDSLNRKNSMDYASPLNTCETPLSGTNGYNTYNRRPVRPTVPILPSLNPVTTSSPTSSVELFQPSTTPPPLPEPDIPFEPPIPDMCLKDVFKNRDPTASPFC